MATKAKNQVLSQPSDNGREAPEQRSIVQRDVILPVVNEAQIDILTGHTPAHAIKTRPGRGGRIFRYVPHGYVTDALNKAFGFNWSYRLLPVFNGNVYQLTVTEEEFGGKRKSVRNVCIYGELTVRVPDPRSREAWLEITKPGPGSQNWEETIEFGDALKGAKSDGLKVAAHELGVALDLYYDDESELQRYEEKQRIAAELERDRPPQSIAELLSKATNRWQISAVDIVTLMNVQPHQLPSLDVAATWQRLVEKYGEAT